MDITTLKKVAKETIELGESLSNALSDGKISFIEGIKIAWESKDLYYVYTNWETIKAEFKDMTSEESIELRDYIKTEFNLENAEAELKIEKSLDLIAAIVDYAKIF